MNYVWPVGGSLTTAIQDGAWSQIGGKGENDCLTRLLSNKQ